MATLKLSAFAGGLLASAKRWLRPSFLTVEILDTPGRPAGLRA